MAFDLASIILIGCLLEGFTTKISSVVFNMAPTITFALLFTFMAVVRWNLWGLLVIPFFAVATMLGGMNSDIKEVAAFYDWRVLISEMVGLSLIGLDVIIFKIKGTKNIVKSIWLILIMVIANYLIYCGIQMILYWICCGDISGNAKKLIDSTKTTYIYEEDNVTVKETITEAIKFNVYNYGKCGLVFNLLGLVVAIIGVVILKSQGVLANAVEKLIADRKEAEFNNLNTNDFRIVADSEELTDSDEDSNEEKTEEENSDSL